MPDDPFAMPLPGGQSVPTPGMGGDPVGSNININEILKKMLAAGAQNQNRTTLPGPGVGAQRSLATAQDRAPMQVGPTNRATGAQQFMYNIGAAVQNAVKAKKEKDISSAMNDWQNLQKAWDDSQTAAQQGKDPMQVFQSSPSVQAILGDPKKMKNIAKSLQMDWLNPEKTTVYQEAAKRHVQGQQQKEQQQKAQGMMQKLKSMFSGGQKPQMNPQQNQQLVAQEAEKMKGMATPTPPDHAQLMDTAKLLVGMKEADAKIQEHSDDMKMKWMEHIDNLNFQKQRLDEQMMDKNVTREQSMELRKQGMQLQAQIAQGNQAIKMLAIQSQNDRADIRRTDAMRKSNFLVDGKVKNGADMEEGDWANARPVKDVAGLHSQANTYKTIIQGFNNIADPKYDKLWDDPQTNKALTQMMQHFGTEGGAGGGAGGVFFKAPAGLSDTMAKQVAENGVPDKLKPLFYEYVSNLRGMQERVVPLTMLEQQGKVGRGSNMAFAAVMNALPGAGTMSSQQAHTSLYNVRNIIDMHADDFGGYDGDLIGGMKPVEVKAPDATAPKTDDKKKPGLFKRNFPDKNPLNWLPQPGSPPQQ